VGQTACLSTHNVSAAYAVGRCYKNYYTESNFV